MSDDTPGLEARIDRVEAIAAALESDRLELDEALALFEEGVRHLRAAREMLRDGELRVDQLLADFDGEAEDAPE